MRAWYAGLRVTPGLHRAMALSMFERENLLTVMPLTLNLIITIIPEVA